MKRQAKAPFNGRAVIVTGELSGEMHAAHLVDAIRKKLPLDFSGIGSRRLARAGVRIIEDYEHISVVGISEIVARLGHIRRAYRSIGAHLSGLRPSLLILIDFPGFNLRLAKVAGRLGIPTVYFIPPQVWAWNTGRIEKIRKYVDLVITILPFEEELYQAQGVPVVYVGHPFTRTVTASCTREEFFSTLSIPPGSTLLSLLPGSRENEIRSHLPLLLQVVELIAPKIPGLAVVVPLAENTREDLVHSLLPPGSPIVTVKHRTYDALAASDVAIIASGSATLEAAILGTPAIVVYKISRLSYLIARLLVKVNYISLPNIIADKEIYPEHIQRVEPEKIADQVISMVKNGTSYVRGELQKISESLVRDKDPYERAADEIIAFVEKLYGPLS